VISIDKDKSNQADLQAQVNRKRWLSPSSINTYLRCPRKFYLQYVRKLKKKPSIHLIRGLIIHKTIERFFNEEIAKATCAHYNEIRNRILSIFKEEWTDKKATFHNLKLKDQDLEFLYSDSSKMIINWLHDYLRSKILQSQEPECEKTLFSRKWMVMGRIDAIYSGRDPPLMIDYKTCKSLELTDDYKRQLGIYALLYEEKHGIRPITGIHYVKFQNGLRIYKIRDTFLDNLKKTIKDIHQKTKSINEKDYPCTCNGWCRNEFTSN